MPSEDTDKALAEIRQTRAERLRATFEAYAAWAETATTDDVPGELPGETPSTS
ncbi:MAG: hypothetical protein ACOYOQ_00220 [Microthrixaceae bacterium]